MAIRHRLLGGDLHPFYRAVLSKAVSLDYSLPSTPCRQLQNGIVRALATTLVAPATGILWNSLDWLYIMANDSGDNNFGRINWINPNEIASGSPTVVHKKGWYGSAGFGHAILTGPNLQAGNSCMFFYSTVGGAYVGGSNEPILQQSGSNGYIFTMRHRNNPRVDSIHGGNISGVQAFPTEAGGARSNTLYFVDMDTVTNNFYRFFMNTTLYQSLAAGTGALPNDTSLAMAITSPRTSGIVGGGRSIQRWHGTGGVVGPQALATILHNYMTAIQALTT